MKSHKKLKDKKGFTLVELLVVIAIIGILAIVAVPALFDNINKSKVAKLESDYNAVKSATLSYYADNNKLAKRLEDLDIDGFDSKHTPLGGDYKIRMKNENNEIVDSGKNPMTFCKVNELGEVSARDYRLDDLGDAYLTIQGHTDNKMHINEKQFKKIVEDIGHENVYISGDPDGLGYQTSEIYIRIANNMLPKRIQK